MAREDNGALTESKCRPNSLRQQVSEAIRNTKNRPVALRGPYEITDDDLNREFAIAEEH